MLVFEQISASYDQNKVAVAEVDFQIEKPAIVGIIGPNGAGKSTLIKAALKLIPAEGALRYRGRPLAEFQKGIAYVEQKSAIDYSFPITVEEVVSLGLYPGLKPWQSMKKSWGKVAEALSLVKIQEFAKRQIGELSGGQFQRVLLARTLVQDADLIFLDEPFVGIDATSEQIIMGLLRDFRDQGKIILIVHHDLSKVTDYFDECLILNQRKVAYGPTAEVFNEGNLKVAFGDSIFVGGMMK